MSQDTSVVSQLISGLHKQSVKGQRAGQDQQWRLAFEKAYLESRKDGGETGDSENVNKGSGNGEEVVLQLSKQEAENLFNSISWQQANTSGLNYLYSGNLASLINVLHSVTNAGDQHSYLRATQTGATIHMRSATSMVKPAIEAALTQRSVPTRSVPVEDKQIRLFLNENGLELFIRDADLKLSEAYRLVARLRDFLSSQSFRLYRVSVNAEEIWRYDERAGTPADAGVSEESFNIVDRTY